MNYLRMIEMNRKLAEEKPESAPEEGLARGTQAIERAAMILREISSRGRFGWRPSDLAVRCGLDRSTTHRILAALVRERLVHQRRSDRHYLPGPLLFEMGQAMPGYSEFQQLCAPSVKRLARRFKGLALVHLHSRNDTVCISRAGESVYVGTAMEVGTRWPLIASAGGVAILIALPKAERVRVERNNFTRLATRSPAAVNAIRAMIARSESMGFAFNRGETATGVHACALPLVHRSDKVLGSLAVAFHAEEVPQDHMEEVVGCLNTEVATLETAASSLIDF